MAKRLRLERVSPKDLEVCFAIRRTVFVEGQGVSEEIEIDGLDPECTHFLARLDETPVATARLRETGGLAKAERVAVLEAERGYGVGRALMEALEAAAAARSLGQVLLHAQVPVIPFYEKLGYAAEGDVFLEDDIAHRVMRKKLR
jgi:predicted GNAT family N-acyltransferase